MNLPAPYYQDSAVTLYHGDNVTLMREMESESVDLVVTSPPYDNLRTYGGHTWDFAGVAGEMTRLLKPGGVIVWVVADATVDGSETLTSMRQAIHFKDVCWLNVHDTMIWSKGGFTAVGSLVIRYAPVFEYMFILSKGKPATFNPIKDRKNKWAGFKNHGTIRRRDGSTKTVSNNTAMAEYGQRFNIWEIPNPGIAGNQHPAVFPIRLAMDHIQSWSNPGDTVLDPFSGSGTTCLAAMQMGRNGIGLDAEEKYCGIAATRISGAVKPVTAELQLA